MLRTRRIVSSALLTVALVACGSSGNAVTPPPTTVASPQTATINATPSLAFSPNAVTIAPGGMVTFAFGSVGHSVKFDTGTNPPADIPGVNANTSISRTFAVAGTYTFHCTIHPNMTGTVTVAATMNGTVPPPSGGNY